MVDGLELTVLLLEHLSRWRSSVVSLGRFLASRSAMTIHLCAASRGGAVIVSYSACFGLGVQLRPHPGDVLDTGLLVGALAGPCNDKRRVLGALVMVLPVGVLDLLAARRASRA